MAETTLNVKQPRDLVPKYRTPCCKNCFAVKNGFCSIRFEHVDNDELCVYHQLIRGYNAQEIDEIIAELNQIAKEE